MIALLIMDGHHLERANQPVRLLFNNVFYIMLAS